MNHMYRIIWHEAARRLRDVCLLAVIAWGHGAGLAQVVAPPAPGQLPTGPQVVAGQAAISQAGAVMQINQASNRAAIDWQSFNVGAQAQVKFNQPSSTSATLNRVLDANPSQIFGRISANGQVILTNPNGVHFAPGASVDVGGLTATTHSISNADFMAGKSRYSRDGATGSVVNEGKLTAALGGYITLLAPEVRNSGVIFAQMGTVALAAGEVIELQFDSNHALTKLRVEPATIKTLVENKLAVKAPGGLIILSSQAVSQVQGGVVKNSGVIEATGIKEQGGRILLEASHQVENTGTIQANAGPGNTAAGSITVTAPEIVNSGTLEAKANTTELIVDPDRSTGATANITLEATRSITQTGQGRIDVSAPAVAGEVHLHAPEIALSGTVNATATPVDPLPESPAPRPSPGLIEVVATRSIRTQNAVLDASGPGGGGRIAMQVTGTEGPSAPTTPQDQRPTLALLGNTLLRTSASRGRGGQVTLTGENITLRDTTQVDATGATGGGTILVGGSWQNSDTRIPQATFTTIGRGVVLDASATDSGNGGNGGTVVAWSDVRNPQSFTRAYGTFLARGGVHGGDGGRIETSGHRLDVAGVRGDAAAPSGSGKGGLWLFDPYNVAIVLGASSSGSFDAGTPDTWTPSATGSTIIDTDIESRLNAGTSVTVTTTNGAGAENGSILVNAPIDVTGATPGTFTLQADKNIYINANIASANGPLNLVLVANKSNTRGSVAIFQSATVSTKGGNVWIGGGSGTASWKTLTVGDGGGVGNNWEDFFTGISGSGTIDNRRGVTVSGVLNAEGGDIYIHGQNGNAAGARGVGIGGTVTTSGGGSIEIIGTASGTSSGIAIGDTTYYDALSNTNVSSTLNGSASAGTGGITLTGTVGGGTTNGGIQLVHAASAVASTGNLALTSTGKVMGAGSFSVSGTTSLTAGADNVTLTNTSNSFTGAVSIVSAANVGIKSATNLSLGAVTMTGNLNAEALNGNLTVNGALSRTAASAGTATLKATGNVNFTPTGALTANTSAWSVVLHANSDGETTNGGSIELQIGSGISTNGGHVWMGGGSGSTTWNGLTVGNAYAYGTAGINGISFQGTLSTGDGHVSLAGQATNFYGIYTGTTATITSTSGNVALSGTSTGNMGVMLQGDSGSGTDSVTTTTGSISVTGSGNVATYGGVYVENARLLSTSGAITLDGTNSDIGGSGIKFDGGGHTTLGYKAGGNSSSAIRLVGDSLDIVQGTVASSGPLAIEPKTAATTIGIAGGAGTLQLPASYFSTNFTNGFSGITIGSDTGTGDITANAFTYSDPITLRNAGSATANISLSGAIQDGTGTSSGSFTAIAGGQIAMSSGASITTHAANVLFNANSTGADYAFSSAILLSGNGNNITSNGGNITLGGGASKDGSGYASGSHADYVGFNTVDTGSISVIDAGGGNIAVRGRNTNGNAGMGPRGVTFTTSGGGSIVLDGLSTVNGSGNYGSGIWNSSGAFNVSTQNGPINITGIFGGTASTSGGGVVFGSGNSVTSQSGVITITGVSGTGLRGISSSGSLYIGTPSGGTPVDSGPVNLFTDSIALQATDRVQSTGALSIAPYTANTTIGIAGGAGTLQLPASYFSSNFTNGFSSITVGNASAGDITVGTSALTYNDPLTLKTAGSIVLSDNAALTGGAGSNSLVLWADGDAANGGYVQLGSSASITTNGGHLWIGGSDTPGGSTTWNGLTVGDGYAKGSDDAAGGIPTGVWLDDGAISTNGGHIKVRGQSAATSTNGWQTPDNISNNNASGIESSVLRQYSINAGSGTITLDGKAVLNDASNYYSEGVYLNGGTLTSAATGGNAITITGDASGAILNGTAHGAGVAIIGWTTPSRFNTISATGGGHIVVTGVGGSDANNVGDNSSGIRISGASGAVNALQTSGAGNITLTGSTGSTAVNSRSVSTSIFDTITAGGDLSVNGTGKAISLLGRVTVGGTTNLSASGLPITANHTLNDFSGTVNATGSSVSILDSNAMTLGAVSASGVVNIATSSGNLTLAGAINAGTNAVTLNAGKNTNPGTSTGGDIIVSGGSLAGSTGLVRLFSGSAANSTGLSALLPVATYTNADETSTLAPPLGASGIYAIYREQPGFTISGSTGLGSGQTIRLYRDGGNTTTALTDGSGNYSFTGLGSTGNYLIFYDVGSGSVYSGYAANIASLTNTTLNLQSNELWANTSMASMRTALGGVSDYSAPYTYNVNAITVKPGVAFKTNGDFTIDGNITTQNASQTYGGAVTVTSAATLLAQTSGSIALNGAVAATADTLALQAPGGDITATNAGNDFGTLELVAQTAAIKDQNGLTLGASSISGDVTVEALGGDLTLAGNISKSSGADATVTFKASGSIVQNASTAIASSSNRLTAIFWADSDASDSGSIFLSGNNTITTNGGGIWMGGGAASGSANWTPYSGAGAMTVGTGRAVSDGVASDVGGRTHRGGIELRTGTSLSSGGGNIALYGSGYNSGIWSSGITWDGGTIDAGAGKILLDATSRGSGSVNSQALSLGAVNTIRSSNAGTDAIVLNGDASATTAAGAAIGINMPSTIEATGGGGITLWAKDGVAGSTVGALYPFQMNNASVLANSGVISLMAEVVNPGHWAFVAGGGFTIGQKAGSSVTASSSNIVVTGDSFNTLAASDIFQSSGTLTLGPKSAGKTVSIGSGTYNTSTLYLPASAFTTNFANGFSGVTIGNANAGNITVGNSAITYNDPLTLKTAGSIALNSGASLTGFVGENAHLTLWTDAANANQTGALSAATNVYMNGASITTNGGNVVVGGGSDPATGYAVGYGSGTYATAQFGFRMDNNASVNAGGGNISIRGRTTSTSTSDGLGIGYTGGASIATTAAGTVTLVGDAYTAGAYYGMEIGQGGATTVDGGTLNIVASSASGFNPIRVFGNTTIGGSVAQTINFDSYYTGSSSTAWTTVFGTFGGGTPATLGNSSNTTLIDFQIDRSGASGSYGAVHAFANGVQFAGNNATLKIRPGALHLTRGQTIGGNSDGGNWTQQLATAGSNSNLSGILPAFQGATGIAEIQIGRSDGSGATTVYYTNTALNQNVKLLSGSGGMTFSNALGGSFQPGSGNLTIESAGTLAVNNAVSTTGNLSITTNGAISSTGLLSVTGTTNITAGSGNNITLTHPSNDFTGAVSATGANISITDSNAMSLGVVAASGTVDVATLSGNMTLTGTINAGANAVTLNAGQSTAAGTSTGGDIIVSGGSLAGSTGLVRLFSGSVANSTGLTALVGSGSNRFRYNSDESTANYTTALASGINAIYREQPTVTVTANNASKTYDGLAYTGGNGVTYGGFVNGDTALGLGGTLAYGGTSQGAINANTYAIVPSGYSSGLGYALAYANGALTVNPAALGITASNASKTYGNALSFAGTEFTSSGLKNGETIGTVTLTSTGTSATASAAGGSYAIVPSAATGGTFSPSNYTITYNNGSLTVNPAALGITASNTSKTYGNAHSFAGTEFTSSGLKNGETIGAVTLTSTGAAATATVAGGPYPIIPSNATGGTFSASNYSVSYVNGQLAITPANLTVTASVTGNPTKVYDATTVATLTSANYSLSGFVNGDSATVTKTTGTYDSANAGTRTVTVNLSNSDFAPAGSTALSNYKLPTTASGSGTITPALLTITASDINKTFGDTYTFAGTEFTSSGLKGSDTIGTVSLTSPGSVATATVAGGPYPIIPGNATGGTFSASNYSIGYVNGQLAITPANLTVTASVTGNPTKVYDATTVATLTSANYSLGGFVNGDSATVTKTTGTYDSANAGTRTVTVNLSNSDFAPAGSTALSNYKLPTKASGSGTITPAPLTITAGNANKTFGDVHTFAGTEFTSSGLKGNDTIGAVSLASTGSAATATVAGGPYPIIPSNATGGTFSSSNYSVSYVNGQLAITPANLTVTASVTGNPTKVYDATTVATLTSANYSLSGFVNGDSATVTKVTGTYDSANAGTRTVTVNLSNSDFAPAGSTALSNYKLPTTATGSGTITPAPLTITAGNANKTFGDVHTFAGTEFTSSGLKGNDTIGAVSLASTGSIATATVAGGPYPIIPSNATGGTFSTSNYSVSYVNGQLVITPANLTVTASVSGNPTKVYDATNIATLTSANYSLSGFVNGDSATVTKTTGTYDSANAGTRTVTVNLSNSDFVPAGSTALSNYKLPTTATGSGTITPAPLTITAGNANKTFGDVHTFAGTEFTSSGLKGNDTIGVVSLTSTGSAATATVAGGPYPIIPSNATGGTFSASNYSVSYVNGQLAITPASLTVTASVTGNPTKVYDATNIATLTSANYSLSGFINGDGAAVTKTTGTYDSADAGVRTVTVNLASSDFSAAARTDLGNYKLPTTATGLGTITPAPLTIKASNASKTFGEVKTFVGTEFTSSGLKGSDTVGTVSLASTGSAATATVVGGPYPIIPGNATGGSFNASNYAISYVNGQLAITPANLTVTASVTGNPTKVYDATTVATLTSANYSLGGFVNGDSATVTKTTGNYDSANVGTRIVTVSLVSSDFSAAGRTDLSNYKLPTTATGTGTITQAPLTITANSLNKTFGEVKDFTGSEFKASGLKGNDTVGSVTLTSAGSAATASVAGGPYAIVPSNATGGSFNASNYTISYANGQLTVKPAIVTVSASITGNPSKVYDATDVATLTSANYRLSGFANGDGAAVTKTTGSYDSANVGSRTVTVSLAAGDFSATGDTDLSNYKLPTTATGPGTITPKAVTLTAPPVSKVYDAGLSYSATGAELAAFKGVLLGADSVSAATLAFADKNAGSGNKAVILSDVAISDGNGGKNYAVTLAGNSTSSITPAPLTITASSASKVYGSVKTFTGTEFTSSGLKGSDTVGNATLTSNGAAASATVAGGPYAIVVSNASGGSFNPGNYTVAYVNGQLTVTPAPLTASANNDSRVASDKAYSGGKGVAFSGFVNNESASVLGGTLGYGGSSQGAVSPGSYAITPSGYTSSNYTIRFVDGTLTLTEAPPTIPTPPAPSPTTPTPTANNTPVTTATTGSGGTTPGTGGGSTNTTTNIPSTTTGTNTNPDPNPNTSTPISTTPAATPTATPTANAGTDATTPTVAPTANTTTPTANTTTTGSAGSTASSAGSTGGATASGAGAATSTATRVTTVTTTGATASGSGAASTTTATTTAAGTTGGSTLVASSIPSSSTAPDAAATSNVVPDSTAVAAGAGEAGAVAMSIPETSQPMAPPAAFADMVAPAVVQVAVSSIQSQAANGGNGGNGGASTTTALNTLSDAQVTAAVARGMPQEQAQQAGAAFTQALVQHISNGLPMGEAVALAQKTFQIEASFPVPKSPQEAVVKNIASSDMAQNVNAKLAALSGAKTSEGTAAFEKALAVAMLKGGDFSDAVKAAQNAVQQAETLARADNTPQASLASGNARTDVFAKTSPGYQSALGSLLAKGYSLEQAMARAARAAADADAAAKADANNPLAGLSSGDFSLLDKYPLEGAFGKTLGVLMNRGVGATQAMEIAIRVDAQEQQAIQADARNELVGFSKGGGNGNALPQGDAHFDRVLARLVSRGEPPANAIRMARKAVEKLPAEVQTPATALASGNNVDALLSSPGNSRIFKQALGNALARGMPVDEAIALARRAEAANAFRYPLPAPLAKLLASSGNKVEVTTDAGKPLPGWLRFDISSRSFVAAEVPSGALPLRAVVALSGQRFTLDVTEGAMPK